MMEAAAETCPCFARRTVLIAENSAIDADISANKGTTRNASSAARAAMAAARAAYETITGLDCRLLFIGALFVLFSSPRTSYPLFQQ
jgi:hypothetical protein